MNTNLTTHCIECYVAFHRVRQAQFTTLGGLAYCEEHAQEHDLPATIAHIPEVTLCDHIIRIRLINGPRDYVAYFKGWHNSGTDNSPRWIGVTTTHLDDAMVMTDPLNDFTAIRDTVGPSAMAFLTTLSAEANRDEPDPLYLDRDGDTYDPSEVGA